MALNVIFSANLQNFRPVLWYGQPVYARASNLRALLGQYLGDEFKNFLAEPHIVEEALQGSGEDGHWLSEYITSSAKSFTQLSGARQLVIKQKLSVMLEKINGLSEKLKESPDKELVKWSEIITKAVEIPSMENVLVDGERISLVLWGFTNENTEKNKFRLSEAIQQTSQINVKPPDQSNYSPNETKNNISSQKDTKTKDTKDANKKPFNFKNRKFLIWLLAGLGLLLLVFLLVWMLKGDKNLPPEPGVYVPIDTTKIIKDPNGRDIISNRLNIAILDKKANIKNFAEKFKQAYPDDEYKIIYYDTATLRLQIEIPANEQNILKVQIKQKLPEFNMLIWDEGVMKNKNVPSDPDFKDQSKSYYFQRIKAYEGWNVTQGNGQIIVAIIDDGFDLSHVEFQGKIVNPYNIADHSQKVQTWNGKLFHGTHVASLAIGLGNNQSGVAGIAMNCRFMPVQVGDASGNMSSTAVIDAIMYAVRAGAQVINMSLGMMAPTGMSNVPQSAQKELIKNLYKDEEQFWEQLLQFVDSNNVTVVMAGGNDDVLIGLDPMQRSEYCIKVSAVDPNTRRATFSNYGDYSTLSAPGVHIYSALPQNNYNFLDGTSMASPIVAGAVALLKSVNATLTNKQIIDILEKTGIPINEPDKYVGNLIQLDAALACASGKNPLPVTNPCDNVKQRIDSLRKIIDSLEQICSNQGDTAQNKELIVPENPNDFSFAKGRWKSSSDITNQNNEKIALFFEFFGDGTGTLTLVEPKGTRCKAGLTLKYGKNRLDITQNEPADCGNGRKYAPYVFTCVSQNNSVAVCKAVNTANRANVVEFTLQKQP